MIPKIAGSFWVKWFFAVAVTLASARAVESNANDSLRVASVAPFPGVISFCASNAIPITGIDRLISEENVRPGDSLTVLVTFFEKEKRTQWILFTQIAAPPGKSNGVMVIHNSFGNKFEFPSYPTPVTLRTIGPFTEVSPQGKAPKVRDDKASFKLDKGYLSLGLDNAAAAVARMQNNTRQGPFMSGTEPFSAEQIAKSRAFADDWKLTPIEERALGGSYPALLSYFEVVQHTDSLESIMMKVIDRPSLLSIAANLGIRSISFNWQTARLSSVQPEDWGMKDHLPIYEIPMVLTLNNHPSLNITMVVSAPRPPLLTSAGILGVLAQKPGKTYPCLTIRIVSARLASVANAAGK